MNRRTMLGMLGKLALAGSSLSKISFGGISRQENITEEKLVLIFDSRTQIDYQRLLDAADVCLGERDPFWQAHLTLLDMRIDKERIAAFVQKFGPNTKSLNLPLLVSIPSSYEFDRDVEIWNMDWLRSRSTYFEDACYPVSGNWWSVEGDFNPPLSKVQNHCYSSTNHSSGKFKKDWLLLLKYEEIMSLHSDHHREMIGKGKVNWKNVNAECPAGLS